MEKSPFTYPHPPVKYYLSIISQDKPRAFSYPSPFTVLTSSPGPFSFEKRRGFNRSCPSKEKGSA